MIKAVIFDIDNTMYDYDAAHAIAMDALTAHCTSAFSIGKEEFPELCSKAQRMVEDRIGWTARRSTIVCCGFSAYWSFCILRSRPVQ
jgi:FMN phosphatase YigB (HAD superfamily)